MGGVAPAAGVRGGRGPSPLERHAGGAANASVGFRTEVHGPAPCVSAEKSPDSETEPTTGQRTDPLDAANDDAPAAKIPPGRRLPGGATRTTAEPTPRVCAARAPASARTPRGHARRKRASARTPRGHARRKRAASVRTPRGHARRKRTSARTPRGHARRKRAASVRTPRRHCAAQTGGFSAHAAPALLRRAFSHVESAVRAHRS
jgi:hypothetical protein